MSNFLELTEPDGTPVIINANSITFIEPASDKNQSVIRLIGDNFNNPYLRVVNHSLSEIYALIEAN